MRRMENLKLLQEQIDTLKGISSSKAKIFKLKQLYDEGNELLFKVLKFCIDPSIKSGISKKKIEKNLATHTTDRTFSEILDYVAENNTGTGEVVSEVQSYINQNKEYESLIKEIITQSLKIGVNVKAINQAIPNFIQTIEFMRAKTYMDRYEKGLFNFKVPYVISEKLDGIRGVIIKDKDTIRAISRQGKEFVGIDHILDCFESLGDGAYDGEFLATGYFETDEDRFQKTCSLMNSKATSKPDIEFIMFDYIPLEDFYKGYSPIPFVDRLNKTIKYIDKMQAENKKDIPIKSITKRPFWYQGTVTHDLLMDMVEECDRLGKEGIMINSSIASWEGKRSNNILKLKKTLIADVRIIGFVAGDGKHKGRLGALEVEFDYKNKKNICSIGTGFSDEEREEIWQNQKDYLGKIIEVNYQKITKNETGEGYSLGFASYNHRVRDDKSETSIY